MDAKRMSMSIRLLAAGVLLSAMGACDLFAQSVTFVPNAVRYAGVGTSSGGFNTDTGVATATRLSAPSGLAFDGGGNLIIADRNNNCVRRVDPAVAHVTTTIAGLAVASGTGDTCNTASNAAPSAAQGLLAPLAVAADAIGNVFIADTGHNCVRELPAGMTGVARLQTVAGTCGATPAASTTPVPTSLALDAAGTLYILNRDTTQGTYQVLRRATSGTLCRVAGAASSQNVAQCSDVPAVTPLNGASGIALDGTGALYIADTGNNCVRKVSGGTVSTALGTCGSATSAILRPTNVAFSLSGALYVTLTDSNQLVRYNVNTGGTRLLAGNANMTPGAYSSTQDGAASTALPLNGPRALVIDANDNLYLADAGNNIVRELRSGNLFGATAVGGTTSQQTLTFQINSPSSLQVIRGQDYFIVPNTNTCTGLQTPAAPGSPAAFCSVGIIFTPSAPGNRNAPLTIRDNVTNYTVATGLQGMGLGPLAKLLPGVANQAATLSGTAIDVATDTQGRYYVLVQTAPAGSAPQYSVRRYEANGSASTLIVPSATSLKTPVAIALDAAENLYVADTTGSSTGAPSIQRYGDDGTFNVDFVTGIATPAGLSVDGFGNMFIAEAGTRNDILKVFSAGGRVVLAGGGSAVPKDGASATSVALGQPADVVLSPTGTVYFSDSKAQLVYSIDGSGLLHTIAGTGSSASTAAVSKGGGIAALSQALLQPTSLAVDPAGDLYIVDTAGNRVYLFFPGSQANMNLSPILGTGTAGASGNGGVSTSAAINAPSGIAIGADGTVFVGSGVAIRSVTFPAQTLDFGTVAVGSTNVGLQPFVNTGNTNLVRTQDPTLTNADFTFDGGDSTCSSVLVSGQLCDFAFSFAPATTGPKSASASITDDAPNSPQRINLTGTVVPAIITSFTAGLETETYGGPYTGTVTITTNGGTVPNGTVTFNINGAVTCVVTGPLTQTTTCTLPAGTLLPVRSTPYPVTVTFTGNYPNQTATTSLTVLPRTLTETVNNQTKVYLQPNPVLTGTPNGRLQGVGTDSFTVTYGFGATPITTATLPGTYTDDIIATVTANGNTVAGNYNIVVKKGTFTVTPATLQGFGADSQTEAYGGTYTASVSFAPIANAVPPSGTITFRTGTTTLCSAPISGATATCTKPAGTGLQAGTYPVTVSYDGDANYAAATTATTLTVTRVPLTVTVPNQTKAFGAPVPNLTGTATVTGLVNGDAVGGTIILTYSTSVTAATPVGTYPNAIQVAVSGSSANSYVISNTPGSYTVGGLATTATLTTSATSVASGVPVTFTAKITSGSAVPDGPVVFTSDSQIIGTVVLDATGTATLTTGALGGGTHAIRAAYAGNGNFAASSATVTVSVIAPVGSFRLTSDDAQFIRGPGSRTFHVTLSSVGGFAGIVSLSCSGLPADAKCALSNDRVALTVNETQVITVTTTTTLADATVSRLTRPRPGTLPLTAAFTFPLQLSGLGMLALGLRRRRIPRHVRLVLALVLSFGLLGLAGCGSTAFYHIYPVTVTGTSVGGGPAPASATVYLAVGTP